MGRMMCIKEVADELGKGADFVYGEMHSVPCRLPFYRIGRNIRVDESDLKAYKQLRREGVGSWEQQSGTARKNVAGKR